MPDPEMGERACAYVQTRGGEKMGLEEVTAFLKEQGASVLQFPERVEWVDTMPVKGPKGLIDKEVLKKDIIEKRKEEENDG